MLLGLLVFAPSIGAFASTGDVLLGKQMIRKDTGTFISAFTDGSDDTYGLLNKKGYGSDIYYYDFPKPTTVNKLRIYGTGYGSISVKLFYLNNTSEIVYQRTNIQSGGEYIQTFPTKTDVVKVEIANPSGDSALNLATFSLYGEILDEIPPGDVTDIKVTPGEEDITFTFTLPKDSDFSHVLIYRDSKLLNGKHTKGSFKDVGLEPNATYEYKFVSVDETGNKSKGVIKTVSTFVPLKDISSLKANPDYNRVDLSWTLPKSTELKHVSIYRDTIPEEKGFLRKMFSAVSVSAADGPTKIFETNGTYFNDLTVKPETTYEYKLTSVGTDGEETDGVTVQATTLEEPTPVIKDPGYEITPEGDYLYTWTSPDKGKVKVLISGNEYQTVDAADKKILIPKDKMKYKMMGEPDISLQPISEYGKEGEIHEESPFEEGMLPFEGGDLLKTSMSLLVVLGPFILLALAFLIYPKLKQVISKALEARKGRGVKK